MYAHEGDSNKQRRQSMQFTAISDSYNIIDCNQRHLNRFLNRCLLHVINSLLLTAIIDGYNRFFAWHMPLTTRFPHAYAHDQFHTASILPKTLTQSSYSPSDQDTLLLFRILNPQLKLVKRPGVTPGGGRWRVFTH
jgi:hypothetical protein